MKKSWLRTAVGVLVGIACLIFISTSLQNCALEKKTDTDNNSGNQTSCVYVLEE